MFPTIHTTSKTGIEMVIYSFNGKVNALKVMEKNGCCPVEWQNICSKDKTPADYLKNNQSNTGKSTHEEHKIPGDGPGDQYSRLGYWPDRSQHYAGW